MLVDRHILIYLITLILEFHHSFYIVFLYFLLFQIDEMRSQISEKDLQIEEQKLNINCLEQKLLDEGQKEKIIDDLRADIQAISSARDMELNVRLSSFFFLG